MKRTVGWVTACAAVIALSAPPAYSSNEPVLYVVGFREFPREMRSGDSYMGGRVIRTDPVLHFAVVQSRSQSFRAQAARDSRVRYAESDPQVKMIELTVNDSRWVDQYGPAQIRAPEAWDTTLGSTAKTLCVVDTGVRSTHEDLGGDRWLGGTDFVNDDSDPADDNGHGTHVTGIAAATTNNALGIAGVSQSGILGAKVLDSRGFGTNADVASGIRWCADNGGNVINLSLSGGASQAVDDAVVYAWGKGSLLVAAAGNSGPCNNCVGYPARYGEVIAVTCTDQAQAQCSFSSDGPESELAAPGSGILSTYGASDSSYTTLSGTSMSTPHVAGTAALVWSHRPELTNAQLREVMQDSAHDLGAAGRDELFGWGVVDARSALDASEIPDLPETPMFDEAFDDGAADGWTLTGLWHISSGCAIAASVPNYLGYQEDVDCDYSTGARTSGSATFTVDLGAAVGAGTLSFRHRFEKENLTGSAYDVMRVQVSVNGGGSWTTLRQWDSRNGNRLNWEEVSIDLDPYAGSVLMVRFFFDSIDKIANKYDGWFIDDVEVSGHLPPPNQSPVADAGPDQTVVDADGSGSETVNLDGTASSDSDGAIDSFEWYEGDSLVATGSTPSVTLGLGDHTLQLRVTDDDGATATDEVAISVSAPEPVVLLEENFDDGTADGWGLTGLWHVSELCSVPPSIPNYLGYNEDSDCEYSTGARTKGTATVDVDLTGLTSASLAFTHRFEKENYAGGIYDVMRVQVSTNGGSSWTTLKQWDSRNPNQLSWITESLNLSAYTGQLFKLRFLFDSVDGVANKYDGWFIDDVVITGEF